MKFSDFFTSKDNIQLDKKTLVILRWIAIVGQYLTISIVYFVLKFELPFFYCSIIIFIGILTNFLKRNLAPHNGLLPRFPKCHFHANIRDHYRKGI